MIQTPPYLSSAGSDERKYRPNVGLMIINRHKKVWVGLRSDADKLHGSPPLQMPQGGIDTGETPEAAAWRELYEETGLTRKTAQIIAESDHWYYYDFPHEIQNTLPSRKFIGQRQKWFLFLLTGTDDDVNLTVYPNEIEFSSFSWKDIDEVPKLVVYFKQAVYEKVIREFAPIIKKLKI
ncbi:MAG: RNA pyrophosphohydrolase [Alphaproteobacteria bacterium]